MNVLVAGIGNILMGDDGFGVEVVRRFTSSDPNVRIVDFGIRGFDLALALSKGDLDAALLIDASSRGNAPGTVTVLEPDELSIEADRLQETHGLHPMRALAIAKTMGRLPRSLRVIVCEPEILGTEDEPILGLSPRVAEAVPIAISLIEESLAHA
jgi:hydrogenase maturation protease